MNVINMPPTYDRILAFCNWQTAQPKFTTKAEWRASADAAGFTDIGDASLPRVVAMLRDLAASEFHHANLLAAETAGKRVIEQHGEDDAEADQNSSSRLQQLHYQGATLDELSSSIGTPEEWLASAMGHLKCAVSEQRTGIVRVASAAVDLLIWRIEELEHGGEPWKGNPA